MAGRRRRPRLPSDPVTVDIEDLTHEGLGVARVDGKATFIDGALPGERVSFRYTRVHSQYDHGQCEEVLSPAAERVSPGCAHFGVCGGCALQHLDPDAQVRHKAHWLEQSLTRIGKVTPEQWLAPLRGPLWGYRHKARLGVKYVKGKGRVLVGFRERHAPYVADIESCPVLHPAVGERLLALSDLIGGLSVSDRVAQIEVAVGEPTVALSLRVLSEPSEDDKHKLVRFAQDTGIALYLQPAGNESTTPLWPQDGTLSYALPDFDLTMAFKPFHFTQVNPQINRQMIRQALEWLDLQPGQRVLDLFCGLGNFTLPLARNAASVVGVEGDASLVEWAGRNARANGLDNAEFHAADLTRDQSAAPWWGAGFERVLLDPPRSGALEVLPLVAATGARRLVYVSCHPATLARDAGILVHEHGYRLLAAGVMDMFPHTAHVESMAVFDRP